MVAATSCRIHVAVEGLLQLAQAALPGVVVVDGPRSGANIPDEMVLIGWDPQRQNHVDEIRQDQDENLCDRHTAIGSIACYIAVRRGDGDMSATRGRGVELLQLLEAAVRAEPTPLGGVVDFAAVDDDIRLTQFQTGNDGSSVGLAFGVHYTAYI